MTCSAYIHTTEAPLNGHHRRWMAVRAWRLHATGLGCRLCWWGCTSSQVGIRPRLSGSKSKRCKSGQSMRRHQRACISKACSMRGRTRGILLHEDWAPVWLDPASIGRDAVPVSAGLYKGEQTGKSCRVNRLEVSWEPLEPHYIHGNEIGHCTNMLRAVV